MFYLVRARKHPADPLQTLPQKLFSQIGFVIGNRLVWEFFSIAAIEFEYKIFIYFVKDILCLLRVNIQICCIKGYFKQKYSSY